MSTFDEPVPYQLTPAGEVATRTLLTASEASAILGGHRSRVYHHVRRGHLVAYRINGCLLVEQASVVALAAASDEERQRREAVLHLNPPALEWPEGYLPAAPLLRQINLRGGRKASGVRRNSAEERALDRAQRSGWLTERMADELSCRLLGLTPREVWGPEAA